MPAWDIDRAYEYPNGKWSDPGAVPETAVLAIGPDESPQAARKAMTELQLEPWNFSIVLPRHGRLVHEQPLLSAVARTGGYVAAVYKSTSTDNGKTWTEAKVTKEAEILELGKALENQSFAAHKISGGNVSRAANQDQRR